MNHKAVGYFIGRIMIMEAVCMLPAAVLCYIAHDRLTGSSFVLTMTALVLLGTLLSFFRPALDRGLHARDGVATVALGWVVISLFGALPLFLSGQVGDYISCFFEIVSGFTTTGASVTTQIESWPQGLVYWRQFANWLGGMGVLVFMLAIQPTVKGSGDTMHILRAESPGPIISKLVPKMRHTARILYLIYIGLTVILIALLCLGGMPFFESLCHAFATAGTGGFSVKNASIGAYDSYYLQTVIAVFMMLFGINFSVYYLILIGDIKNALRCEEVRLYLGTIALSTALIAFDIRSLFPTLRDSIHHAYFQVSSIITTTGFATVDFDLWPQLSKTILLTLMFLGACAGSTGGGMKMSRVLILLRAGANEIRRVVHPRSVKALKLDGQVLAEPVLAAAGGYLVLYCLIAALSMLAISPDSPDFTTTFSAVASCFNNIGPGFSAVGASGSYAGFSGFSKLVLSFDMLAGRLEIFPMLLLFYPSTWSRRG